MVSLMLPYDWSFRRKAVRLTSQIIVDEPWPLEVYGHDGKAVNVTMEPGDMVLVSPSVACCLRFVARVSPSLLSCSMNRTASYMVGHSH
jgi:hypothetical protein